MYSPSTAPPPVSRARVDPPVNRPRMASERGLENRLAALAKLDSSAECDSCDWPGSGSSGCCCCCPEEEAEEWMRKAV